MVDRNHINGDKLGMLMLLGFPHLFKSSHSVDISPQTYPAEIRENLRRKRRPAMWGGAQMGAEKSPAGAIRLGWPW